MTFTTEQTDALKAPLSRDSVKTRTQSGRSLSYIESWKAISEANRIFGFDGWSRETVEIKCVTEHERTIGQKGDKGWGVTYTGKVRVTVNGIVREGVGAGHGIDRDLGQAHESAIKECESDSAKRALMTFGNPFGLALYDKAQEEVEKPTTAPTKPQEAQTLVPAPQTPPKMAARQWGQDFLDGIRAGNWTADALEAHMTKNTLALVKLRGAEPVLHGDIMALVQTKQAQNG